MREEEEMEEVEGSDLLHTYIVSGLVLVVDLFEWHDVGGEEMSQLGEKDAVAKPLLQFCCRRQVLVDARLDPTEKRTKKKPLGSAFVCGPTSGVNASEIQNTLFITLQFFQALDIAHPEKDKWISSPSHFSLFFTI